MEFLDWTWNYIIVFLIVLSALIFVHEWGHYWVARHSGGTYWGERGFFRIARGRDTLRIESFCYFGTLKAPLPRAEATICTD